MLTKHFERPHECTLLFSNIKRGKGGFDTFLLVAVSEIPNICRYFIAVSLFARLPTRALLAALAYHACELALCFFAFFPTDFF